MPASLCAILLVGGLMTLLALMPDFDSFDS
jgi:hypothetical protein